jgi:hypothetical protein
MDSHSQRFDVVATVSSAGEIRQIELDLVPSLIQPHGHGADKGLDSSSRLIVAGSKSSADVLVVKDLDFKGEVFLELSKGRGTFLMIMTRKGSLMPRVSCSF